jgi:hypothetical protein
MEITLCRDVTPVDQRKITHRIVQFSTAMLAQANTKPQNVLQLFR